MVTGNDGQNHYKTLPKIFYLVYFEQVMALMWSKRYEAQIINVILGDLWGFLFHNNFHR